jgi:hypothetical protein
MRDYFRPFNCNPLAAICLLAITITSCDFDLPSATVYTHTNEEILWDLPFNATYTLAIAWHPDGKRLAVAERPGAESILTGLTITDARPHDYNLRFRFVRRFAGIPSRRMIVGETADGQLTSWSLDDSRAQKYFAGPVRPYLWSLSEDGERLVYIPWPAGETPGWEIRFHDFKTGNDVILEKSTYELVDLRIVPDGSGAVVFALERNFLPATWALYYYALPQGGQKLIFRTNSHDFSFTPSRDGSRIAFVRQNASQTSLMAYDFQNGTIDSLFAIPFPRSELVWLEDERWIAFFHFTGIRGEYGDRLFDLHAYDIASHQSVPLGYHIPYALLSPYPVQLFTIGDTLAFLTQSPAMLSVFDRRDYSLKRWLSIDSREGALQSIAWSQDGEKIFVHARDRSNRSNFYFVHATSTERYVKNYLCSSVSLLPDGRHFLAIRSEKLFLDALEADEPEALFPALRHFEARVHPSGKFAGIVGLEFSSVSESARLMLRLLDLQHRSFMDSLVLPFKSPSEFQWIPSTTAGEKFSAIWREPQSRGFSPVHEYNHLSFGQHRVTPVYDRTLSPIFAINPNGEHFSVLDFNALYILQWRISVP